MKVVVNANLLQILEIIGCSNFRREHRPSASTWTNRRYALMWFYFYGKTRLWLNQCWSSIGMWFKLLALIWFKSGCWKWTLAEVLLLLVNRESNIKAQAIHVFRKCSNAWAHNDVKYFRHYWWLTFNEIQLHDMLFSVFIFAKSFVWKHHIDLNRI